MFLLSITACSSQPVVILQKIESPSAKPIVSITKPPADEAEIILGSLTLEEKIGQLFIFGFSGKQFSADLEHKLSDLHVGSLIYFKHNIGTIDQIQSLNEEVQSQSIKHNKLPLFLMTDQEGGEVTRIKGKVIPPSALSLGNLQDPTMIEDLGFSTGKVLKSLGFNFNLAPVADLSNPQLKSFTGNRSFGDDPDQVYQNAAAFALGLTRAGVLPTFKHFPGHGEITSDSHFQMPQKMLPLEEMLKTDARPFLLLSESHLDSATMIAHIGYPKIDNSNLPATYSKTIITELLKNRFNYQGLIMTDDLEMSGAVTHLKIGERALLAFNAGADLLMVAWTANQQTEAYQYLLQSAKNQKLSLARLDESVKKIIKAKLRYASGELNINPLTTRSSLKEYSVLSAKIAKINFYKNLKSQKPFGLKTKSKFTVISAVPDFYQHFKAKTQHQAQLLLLQKGRVPRFSMLEEENHYGVFYVSGTGTAKILNSLPLDVKEKLIVINCTYPGLIEDKKSFPAIIHISQLSNESGQWLATWLNQLPERQLASGNDKKF